MQIFVRLPVTVTILGGFLALSGPAGGQEWSPRISPTTQDLLGVAATPGQTVAVGLSGTIVTSTDGISWHLADSGTWADLFDIAYGPTTFVISGREVVLEWDGIGTPVPLVETSGGETFTPVMPTSTAVWYGNPDFSGFGFSTIIRYDRLAGMGGGFVTQGPVLAMCPVANGGVVYVTTRGDVAEYDDFFIQTVHHDQDNSAPLDLVAASFAEDCSTVLASNRLNSTDFEVLEFEIPSSAKTEISSQGKNQWSHLPPGLPSNIEITDFLVHKSIIYFFLTDLDTGRARVFELRNLRSYVEKDIKPSVFAGLLDHETMLRPSNPSPNLGKRAPSDSFALTAVGTDGTIIGSTLTPLVFSDGFETGTTASWSNVEP